MDERHCTNTRQDYLHTYDDRRGERRLVIQNSTSCCANNKAIIIVYIVHLGIILYQSYYHGTDTID